MSEHLAATIASSYSASWYLLQHDETFSQYKKSVLPGDPEADLLFTVVIITMALDEIQTLLADYGIGIDGNLGDFLEAAFAAHLEHVHPVHPDVSYIGDSAPIAPWPMSPAWPAASLNPFSRNTAYP